jgi:hypothetical protein
MAVAVHSQVSRQHSGQQSVASSRSHLTPSDALRFAWWCWLSVLLVPFFLFLYTTWSMMGEETVETNGTLAHTWFIANMAYIAIAVPLAIAWRSYVFRDYWKGDCVSPRNYLFGMMSVWITLEIGGMMGLIGCLLTHSLIPNLLPSLVAFMLFTPLWPSGRAMIHHGGNADDPAVYEEPR